MIQVTPEQRDQVDQARDRFHVAVLNVLSEQQVKTNRDTTEIGEEIALEGMFEA